MAQILTTPAARAAAKAWFHDLTYVAGLRTDTVRTVYTRHYTTDYVQSAKAICDELVNRDFNNIDQDIYRVSHYRFNSNLDPNTRATYKQIKPEMVAKYIVYIAQLLQIYWDDTLRTPYEIDEFKKSTLGNAVYTYGQYISAIPNKKSSSRSTSSSGTSKAPGQPPKNNYKQSGPQSGNVRDLKDPYGGAGTPGQKVTADGSFIYKIIGDNPQSKNTPVVFIKPLNASGAEGSTNKIFVSSGNGYTDCTCYFDDPNDATTFLNKVLNSNRVPSNVSNLRVVKNKADPNGYFLVGTEFGICAVSAKTLNEALTENIDVEESLERPFSWEKATEKDSQEELKELHTWMRRG
jgi:hypothetical protein